MPYVETSSGDLFYAVNRGPVDGPSLVLLHGAGGNHLHWPRELRQLPDTTVYALDLPGHGRSEGAGCQTIECYADVVASFLGAIELDDAVVLGHSMGGAIAQTLALGPWASLLSGLVLVGTGAKLRVLPAILDGIHDDFEATCDLITRFAWAPEGSSDEMRAERGRRTLLQTPPDVLWGDFAACDNFDVMNRLSEIETPTLVVVGTLDQLTPPKYARFLAERISDARLVTVEGAGHMVMLERPAETAKAVQRFVMELS